MKRLSAVLGNTTCRFALLDELECRKELLLPHAACRDARALRTQLADAGLDGAVASALCSVVPALHETVLAALATVSERAPVTLRPEHVRTMPVKYRTPETLGMDRLCGAFAARELYGTPVLAVDCGTATTVNVVAPDGAFHGGWIVPGIRTALEAMHARTAQLPDLAPAASSDLYGRDTTSSMRTGVLQQTRLAVAGLAEALAAQWSTAPRIILTGGAAPALLSAWEGHLPTANRMSGDSSCAEAAASQYLQYDEYLVHRGAILCLHLA